MPGSRRKSVRNYLLRGCFLASIMGFIGVTWFFMGAFDVTVAHLRAMIIPAIFLLMIDAFVQFFANERLLGNFFKWIEEKDNEEGREPPLPLARKAQVEVIKFPLYGTMVSMGLWFLTGFVLVLILLIASDVFGGRHLVTIFVSIIGGGAVSIVFQYYFYKVIFHRECPDLIGVQTGLLTERENVRQISFSTKLLVSFLVLMTVGLVYTAMMAGNRARDALLKRQTQLLKPVAGQVMKMRSQKKSNREINAYLERMSYYLGEDVFLFDNEGRVIHGKLSEGLDQDTIKGFLEEFESFITSLLRIFMRGVDYKSRNLPSSSDMFVWMPLENLSIGTVFRGAMARSALTNFGRIFIVLVILAFGVAVWVTRLAANDVSGPLRRVVHMTREIAKGDFSKDIALLSEDELADLAAGLITMVDGLRGLVARVGRAAEQVDGASKSITRSQKDVSEGTHEQARVVEDNTLAVATMEEVVATISENVEVMAVNAQQSAKVIIEMEEISKEVSDNIAELNNSVESTTSAIYEMNATFKEINESVEALSGASEETAASMLQMDRAIKEVEERAKQTLDLSENVTKDAIEGVSSVQSTIEGIGRVEEGVREATEVINRLGMLAEEIGEIVAVINDIADQTNLLALNAAIIAAQAGERGRGFAVVADEIKKLSDRTTSSTKEIRELISTVQGEAQSAVSLMDRESQNVEDGVNLAFQAGQALEKIHRSAQSSVEMVRMIAKTTGEQASNSKRVTSAVEAIAERVALIASSINEQARGAEQISTAAAEMKEIAPMVHLKAQKQVESGRQVTLAMENISEMISYVQKSQERQREQASKIMSSMGQIKTVCQTNVEAVTKLDGTVNALVRQSLSLRDEIKRFRLPQEEIEVEFDEATE